MDPGRYKDWVNVRLESGRLLRKATDPLEQLLNLQTLCPPQLMYVHAPAFSLNKCLLTVPN